MFRALLSSQFGFGEKDKEMSAYLNLNQETWFSVRLAQIFRLEIWRSVFHSFPYRRSYRRISTIELFHPFRKHLYTFAWYKDIFEC